MSKIAFISGHTDLSKYEFETHYQDKILEAIAQKHSFILGSAPGADRMALEFLIEQHIVPTIYLFEKNPENYRQAEELCKQHSINIKTEFTSYTSRDSQMTKNSTYDIAWVRSIDESKLRYGEKFDSKRISGTQRNIERRIKLQK